MLSHLISVHYITIFLVVLLGIKLHAQGKTRDVELRFYWLTLICCALLVVEDVLETAAAEDPNLRFWRTLLSILGYVLRPTAAMGPLLVVCPPKLRTWKLWIPWGINLIVNLTAFFSPAVFYFNENYDFVRGPLGYVVFAVSFLYLLMIQSLIWRRFYEGKTAERWILIVCVVGCMLASLVDSLYGRVHINEAIMISCVFLFIYLRSHDNYLDPLTNLRNRFAFYDDSEHLARDISAAASMDMNGLKELNDTNGHAAGDKALVAIGGCLREAVSRNTIAYRVGGDEFAVLFMRQDEDTVKAALAGMKERIEAAGYSVSAGYAMKAAGQGLEEVLQEADREMYKDKTAYYLRSGKDRRGHAEPREE